MLKEVIRIITSFFVNINIDKTFVYFLKVDYINH